MENDIWLGEQCLVARPYSSGVRIPESSEQILAQKGFGCESSDDKSHSGFHRNGTQTSRRVAVYTINR